MVIMAGTAFSYSRTSRMTTMSPVNPLVEPEQQ